MSNRQAGIAALARTLMSSGASGWSVFTRMNLAPAPASLTAFSHGHRITLGVLKLQRGDVAKEQDEARITTWHRQRESWSAALSINRTG